MSTTHDITGVGPVQANGTTVLYTVKAQAYYATAAQVSSFGRTPVIGDQLTDNGDGTITLISNPGTPVQEQPQVDPVDDGGDDANPNNI
jgi:hypothetical protein